MELLTANRYLFFNLNVILPASAALSTLFFFCPLKMILEQAATLLKIIKNRRRGLGILWFCRWEGDHGIFVSQGQINLSLSLENKSLSFCEPMSIFFFFKFMSLGEKEKGKRYRETPGSLMATFRNSSLVPPFHRSWGLNPSEPSHGAPPWLTYVLNSTQQQ